MSRFSRRRHEPQHERHHIPAQTAPPPGYTAEPAIGRRMRAAETMPIPVSGARPYVPRQQTVADPLSDPDVEITETAVVGRLLDGTAPARAPLPPSRHQPGTGQPSASLIPAGVPRRVVALTGWQIPPAAYPDPARDPGPARYARLMQVVSAATGTSSTYESPCAWAARALSSGGAA